MKSSKAFFKTLIVLFTLTILVGCNSSDDSDPDPIVIGDPDIIDVLLAKNNTGVLLEALLQADLIATLQGNGPFTVFAPTDDAFETFLIVNNYASVQEIPLDVLTQVLLNHVVSGENLSFGLSTGYISSLSTAGVGGNNLSLYIDTANGVNINGVASVVDADNEATNGVVHIVDEVIFLPNIVDHAVANSDLSELVDNLTEGGTSTTFTDLLSDSETDFTVFAPTNDAFNAFTNPNSNAIENILSNHVIVNTAATSNELSNSYLTTAATNADGDELNIYINTDNGVTLNGVSDVDFPNIVATNGIIHAVDAVIDIPTVVTFATADPTFAALVTALTDPRLTNDFVSILNGTGPFTVFAPTDMAFADLLSDLMLNEISEIPEATLEAVLLHHVVSGANIRTEDLNKPGDTQATTLEGDDVIITFPPTDPNIADITDGSQNTVGIIDVNVQAGNGVIHVLNGVLIPDTNN